MCTRRCDRTHSLARCPLPASQDCLKGRLSIQLFCGAAVIVTATVSIPILCQNAAPHNPHTGRLTPPLASFGDQFRDPICERAEARCTPSGKRRAALGTWYNAHREIDPANGDGLGATLKSDRCSDPDRIGAKPPEQRLGVNTEATSRRPVFWPFTAKPPKPNIAQDEPTPPQLNQGE